MKRIKFVVEVESDLEFNDEDLIRLELCYLKDKINKYYVNAKVYEYIEPVEELKPNRP